MAPQNRQDRSSDLSRQPPLVQRYVLDCLQAEMNFIETHKRDGALGARLASQGRAATTLAAALFDRYSGRRARRRAIRPDLAEVACAPSLFADRPKILIDVTPTARNPAARGGIPRVMRELARAAVATGLGLPVELRDGRLFSYFRHPAFAGPIEAGPGDIYVVADIFWYFLDEYTRAIAMIRENGATAAIVIHDMFPMVFPSFFPEEVPRTYKRGLDAFLPLVDVCISVSASSRSTVESYARDAGIAGPAFGHFLLGVAQDAGASGAVRPVIANLFAARPVFLGVGTLEPRKGYDVALDACAIAWSRGLDFSYVVVGRAGWRARALQARIASHPEFGKRLFWLSDLSDAELAFAYRGCRSLVQASIGEGFGLPVIEASRHGAPVIASDLAVFREIAGSGPSYFPVADASALADALARDVEGRRQPAAVAVNDWNQSMRELATCLGRSGSAL